MQREKLLPFVQVKLNNVDRKLKDFKNAIPSARGIF